MKKILLMTLAALALASCSIYKDYQREPIAALDSLYGPGLRDSALVVSYDWRDIFKDPYLVKYIEQGLEHNKDIVMAEQRVKQAQAALMTARGAFLPSFAFTPSVSAASSRERYGGGVQAFSLPLTMSWEIDFAGGKYNKLRRSKAELEQSRIYERMTRSNVICAIADTYYTLLKLDAQLDVSQRTSKSWKNYVKVMQAMMEAGMTNQASISQTEANSCAIEATLYELEYQIRQVQNSLSLLLGTPVTDFERSTLAEAALATDISYGVPASLLSHRPDVMYAEQEVRKAYYDVAIAKAAFYPSLNLTGELGWEKALTSPVGWLYSVAASLAQPLYAGGRIRRNLQIARARQEETAASFEKVLLQAGAEVNNAVALCNSARGKMTVRENQIEALKDAVSSTSQLMRHSQSTYLEVLTALQSLLSAQLLQVSDNYESAQGTIALFKAVGGGVLEEDITENNGKK